MISELDNSRAGFGQQRLIVRGSSFLALPIAATLRHSYNDYPERVALDIGFPQAGRRGPSRPRAATGVGVGGGGVGELPEDLLKVPPPSIYPPPRPRITGLVVEGGAAGATTALTGGCVDEGDSAFSSPNLAAAASRVVPSNRIPRAFVIVHIQYWSENTSPDLNTDVALAIKVADDNDTTGGLDTTGVNIIQAGAAIAAGGNVLEPFSVLQTHYPNSLVKQPGKFIKFAWRNQNAATRQAYAIVSLKYIG